MYGSGRSVLKCMIPGAECEGYYPESMLRRCLPDKVSKAFDEVVAKESLKAACIDNLVACRVCQAQVEMPESAGNILTCTVCQVDTCRLCGEDNHIPLRCNEVEKKGNA